MNSNGWELEEMFIMEDKKVNIGVGGVVVGGRGKCGEFGVDG